jgi:hypothetical protein
MEPAPTSDRVDFFVSYTHDDGWLDTKLRPLILQTVAGTRRRAGSRGLLHERGGG